MGEYRDGKWTPTFGDEQFGVVDSPGQMYNRVRDISRELANAQAMVKRAIKLIEDLLPGIGQTVVDMGELNSWLNDSREYNAATTPLDRVRETRWSKDAMECPNCKEITLVPQLGGDDMWECMDCHCEVLI